MSGRVEGKVVLVTGAARGQGAAEAAALRREGATVIGLDVIDPVERGDGVSHRRHDVSSEEDWAELARRVQDEHGRVDGLVNNAAVTHRRRLGELSLEESDVIDSPMGADVPSAVRDLIVKDIPLGRRGTPDDVAPLLVFLISDESSFISGAEIPVDGGQLAHGGMKALSDAMRG